MEIIKGYVQGVLQGIRITILIAYYKLTAYIPRPLPRTKQEFEDLRALLIQVYGLSDDDNSWYVVCSQITSTEATRLRKSYGNMVNAAKRLQINKLAQEEKTQCVARETETLKTKMELVVNEVQNDSTEARVEPKW